MVTPDRSSTVLLYHLKVSPHSHTLTLLQRIDLAATLWDLTFDLGGDLWVLEASRGSVASVFRAAAEGDPFTVSNPNPPVSHFHFCVVCSNLTI